MLASRQLYLELLDEGCHVLVRDNGTLILLNAKDRLVDMNLQVALDLTLTAEAPVVLDLLTGEVGLLRVEDFSPTLEHLHLTLSARGLTTAGRRQEDAVLVERSHQVVALWYIEHLVAIYCNIHIAAGAQILLCHQQDNHQQDDYQEKYSYTICYKLSHTFN